MKEFSFTVTKTGWIHVEADSLEDAEAKLEKDHGHYYEWLLKLAKICQMVGKPQAK